VADQTAVLAARGSRSATARLAAHQGDAIFVVVVSREVRVTLAVLAMHARVAERGVRHRAVGRRVATVRPAVLVHVHPAAIAHEPVVPPDWRLD
jgi:alkanesulfonate monooxygenase SsuD/methylene tetrahydromethanopterin reductase-like flavin-dependent oxidoreductase (luciferase family)